MARVSRKGARGGGRRPTPGRRPLILPYSASLDSAKLKQLYSTMLGCRTFVERVRPLVSQGAFPRELCVLTGHEALEVGALIHLGEEDCVASDRRDYLARFIQGIEPYRILADLCRRSQATLGPTKNVDSVLPGPTLLAQFNQLTGAAWAFRLQKKPQVAVFLSIHRPPPTDWLSDALRFSAAYTLPIVYIIENDQGDRLRVANPDRGSRDTEAAVAHEGLPCFVVDRNDAIAVYRVAQEAIRRARQGHGPALIECRTCKAAGRPDSTTALNGNAFDDPLLRTEAHLRSKNLWSDKWKLKLVEKFTRQLDRAIRTLQPGRATPIASPSPPTSARGTSQAKTGEPSMFETPVIRDSGRLAGSRS